MIQDRINALLTWLKTRFIEEEPAPKPSEPIKKSCISCKYGLHDMDKPPCKECQAVQQTDGSFIFTNWERTL